MVKNNSPATKDDVSAVKKDLAKVKKNLKGEIKKLDAKIDGVERSLSAEIKITAQETKEDLKKEMSKNTSKILNTFDKFLKEIVDSREERIVVSEKLSNHEDRIEKVEKHVFAV